MRRFESPRWVAAAAAALLVLTVMAHPGGGSATGVREVP
jgi:hypothetical protein